MKKLLLGICGAATLLVGCKENNLPVDFGSNTITHSSYVVSPVPAAEPHQVLIEEFTGQGCSNCPAARADLDNISSRYPGLISVISMYGTFSPDDAPPAGSVNDFRDANTVAILNEIYGNLIGIPAAGIDRTTDTANGSLIQVGNSTWDGLILGQLQVKNSVNLSVTASFDASKNIATITALVTYTQPTATRQNLSIVIVEDGIYDKQDSLNGINAIVLDHYLFMNVFRGMATSVPEGDLLSVDGKSDVKEAGRCFSKVYAYALPVKSPAIVPSNCRIIAFVSDASGADKSVLQSMQCKLVQ